MKKVWTLTIQDFIKNRTSFKVIDVRSNSYFKRGHIEDPINIPLGDLKEKAKNLT